MGNGMPARATDSVIDVEDFMRNPGSLLEAIRSGVGRANQPERTQNILQALRDL
jgi:hypothetical protein